MVALLLFSDGLGIQARQLWEKLLLIVYIKHTIIILSIDHALVWTIPSPCDPVIQWCFMSR